MPVSPYDSAGLEVWFSELAGQGLLSGRPGIILQIFKGKRREVWSISWSPVTSTGTSMKRS